MDTMVEKTAQDETEKGTGSGWLTDKKCLFITGLLLIVFAINQFVAAIKKNSGNSRLQFI